MAITSNLPIELCYHVKNEPDARFEVDTQETDSRPDGYPVFRLGAVIIWPTIAQLEGIHAAIGRYLEGPDGRRLQELEAARA